MKLSILVIANSLSDNYNFEAVRIIKSIMRKHGLYDKYYVYKEGNEEKSNKKPKDFALAVLPYNFVEVKNSFSNKNKVKEKYVENEGNRLKLLKNCFTIIISSTNSDLLSIIASEINENSINLFAHKGWTLGASPIIIPDRIVTKDTIKARILTTVIMKNREGKCLIPDDSEYNSVFNHYAGEIIKSSLNRELKSPITVKSLPTTRVAKVDVNIDGNKYKKIGIRGSIELSGNADDLNALIALGIGTRRSQGYGMIV